MMLLYKKAFEIAVRCGRELSGTPDLIGVYDSAQRDNRALHTFTDFCIEKAKQELGWCDLSISDKEKAKIFAVAAPKIVGLPERGSLETKHNDDEDFMVVSVWELDAALEEAYCLGVTKNNAPASTSDVSMRFSDILDKLGNEANPLFLHTVLTEMVARKLIELSLNEDGEVLYKFRPCGSAEV